VICCIANDVEFGGRFRGHFSYQLINIHSPAFKVWIYLLMRVGKGRNINGVCVEGLYGVLC